jgi:hypothetical protein
MALFRRSLCKRLPFLPATALLDVEFAVAAADDALPSAFGNLHVRDGDVRHIFNRRIGNRGREAPHQRPDTGSNKSTITAPGNPPAPGAPASSHGHATRGSLSGGQGLSGGGAGQKRAFGMPIHKLPRTTTHCLSAYGH